MNDQLSDSIALTNVAVTAASRAGCATVTVVQVGHSLGGDTSTMNVKVLGGEGYAYNAPGSYGIYGNLMGLLVNGVANVHYIDSETDDFTNWLVTNLGQRSAPASGYDVGLLGGTLMSVDQTEVSNTFGHGMVQLAKGLVHPVVNQIEREVEAAKSELVELWNEFSVRSELAYFAYGGKIPVGGLLDNYVSGPDQTSRYARQVGVDAYVDKQAAQEAASRGSIGGGGDNKGGTQVVATGNQYVANPDGTTTLVGGGTKFVGAYTSDLGGTGATGGVGPAGGPIPVTKPLVVSQASRNGFPILLDLNGNGIEIATLDRSSSFVDSNGDGLQHRTAWAGSGDGVLFYDAGMDGLIREKREYVFTEWDPTAKDDMAALRSRFDSNNDGKLNATDAEFAKFKVMVTNADGTKTAKTLAQLNITEINLKTDATLISFADGSQVTGQTTFTMGGVVKTAAAVTLVPEADGRRRSRNIVARLFPLSLLRLSIRRSGFASSVSPCHA